MQEHSRESERDVPSKPTLFCPDCGHRSRSDGDWRVVESCGDTRYLCPDCGAELTVRPEFPSRPGNRPVVAWRPWDGLRVWLRLWRKTTPT
jgi:DNA-directed RNA polymerase subunit RPC12/RpoP